MLAITTEQRRALRAQAHPLHPLVMISQNGLSDAVLREISRSLDSHELIKIRVFSDEREVREAYLTEICEKLGAAPVQHIGKLLVVYRENPEKLTVDRNNSQKTRATAPRRTKRSFQG